MATSERMIETPVGTKVGKIWEKLEILGISSFLTQTQNQPNDQGLRWLEFVDIDVPVGTLAVVPAMNFWFLGHGRLDPDLIDPLAENQHVTWNSADRPWGLGWVHVSVVDVNAPDQSMNPPHQTAQLQIEMHLCDYNMDDGWFGVVGYTLVCLGVPPRSEAITATGLMSTRVAIRPVPLKRTERTAQASQT